MLKYKRQRQVLKNAWYGTSAEYEYGRYDDVVFFKIKQ